MTSDPEDRQAGKEVNSSSSPAVAAAPNGATDTQHSAGWQDIANAPRDGTHILACQAGTSFGWYNSNAAPPVQTVVHWFPDPDEPGFYTSVNEQEPQHPFQATHWKPLDALTTEAEAK